MNATTFQIAVLRAKMVARRSAKRAVELLTAAGAEFRDACRFVMSVLRADRAAA
jgi:hypothetical protein